MKRSYLLYIVLLFSMISCENKLNEETFSSLGTSNFYTGTEDAESLLNGAYAISQGYGDYGRDALCFGEMTTDIMIETGGAINANTKPVEDFTWTASHVWLDDLWSRYYGAIYRSNTVIEKVPDIDMNDERKAQIVAEARFLRALNYYWLYDLWGAVPLISSSETAVTDRPKRATDEEIVSFIESEFKEVSELLPVAQDDYGRATSGAALGFLCKFYLNQKNWEEAAATAKQIMNNNVYSIYTGGNRSDLFALDNEINNEFMYVHPFPENPGSSIGNTYLSHAAPPGYQFKYPPKQNFAAQFRIRTDFINTFEVEDERLDAFLFKYLNVDGDSIELGYNNVRSFKYPEDPNGVGAVSGNDWPLLRYADILLSRAEALNEINGPNQESIDLVNVIRDAAGVSNIQLSDFANKETLNDFILAERGREFHTEGLRRQDLIRHRKFIEMARTRGKNASDYQVLYPIPQSEIDRNENLEQNEGY